MDPTTTISKRIFECGALILATTFLIGTIFLLKGNYAGVSAVFSSVFMGATVIIGSYYVGQIAFIDLEMHFTQRWIVTLIVAFFASIGAGAFFYFFGGIASQSNLPIQWGDDLEKVSVYPIKGFQVVAICTFAIFVLTPVFFELCRDKIRKRRIHH